MKPLLWVLVLLAAGCAKAGHINDHQFMDSKGTVITVSEEYTYIKDLESRIISGPLTIPIPLGIDGSYFVAKTNIGAPCNEVINISDIQIASGQLIEDGVDNIVLDGKEFYYQTTKFNYKNGANLGLYSCNIVGEYSLIIAHRRTNPRRFVNITMFTRQKPGDTAYPSEEELKDKLVKAIVSVTEPE